ALAVCGPVVGRGGALQSTDRLVAAPVRTLAAIRVAVDRAAPHRSRLLARPVHAGLDDRLDLVRLEAIGSRQLELLRAGDVLGDESSRGRVARASELVVEAAERLDLPSLLN